MRAKLFALRIADAARRQKRRGRNRGVDADQRDAVAASHERELGGAVVAAEILPPQAHGVESNDAAT